MGTPKCMGKILHLHRLGLQVIWFHKTNQPVHLHSSRAFYQESLWLNFCLWVSECLPRLSFCFHTGVGSLGFWRPTQMYESGLGFKDFFGCPGEPLYHHHMLHTTGEQLGCNNFNHLQWGISLFPLWNTSTKQKKIWPGW